MALLEPEDLQISEKEYFSIYNTKNGRNASVLNFLRGDDSKGWKTQRNLLKGLNHLSLLQEKESLAELLLLHNTKTTSKIFGKHYQLLELHQKGKLTSEDLIDQITQRTTISREKVTSLLQNYPVVGHMEFHPSDICNLRCQGCTYGHDTKKLKPEPVCFPFNKLETLTSFQPKSILISGGGEPTLYFDRVSGRKYSLNDLVLRIKELMPKTRLALVTNGTHRPSEDDWLEHLDWIRISIDAASAETYGRLRGKPRLFGKVLDNLVYYLKSPVEYVGASYLYSKANIEDYVDFARVMFNLVCEKVPKYLYKFNLQFRPLRQDPKDRNRDFPESIDDKEIKETISSILELVASCPDIESFLRDQTNITAVLGGNAHPPHNFSRCYYSQVFKIIRANGEVRPCFIRVVEPDFIIGNVLKHKSSTIALNSLYIAAAKKKDCDPEGCRQCHLNYLFEAGLAGKIVPSKAPAVANDFFF